MNRADRRKTAKTSKDRVEEYMAAGLALMEPGGNLHDAQRHYRQVLAVDPGHADANLQLGTIEVWMRNYPKAEEFFALAYKRNPQNPTILNNLALSLHEQGKVGPAMPLYEQALKMDPENPSVRINFARGLMNVGQGERALAEAQRGVEIQPENGMGWFIMGTIHQSLGHREEAASAMTKAVHLMPGHMEANFLLARTLFDADDPDACLKPSQDIYEEHGDITEAAMCRAELLYQSGKFKEAEQILGKQLVAKNELLRLAALNILGAVKQALGETEEAIELHKMAITLLSDDPSTRYFYGRTLAQSGDFKEALVQFGKAAPAMVLSQDLIAHLTLCQKMTGSEEKIQKDVATLLKEQVLEPKEIYSKITDLNDAVMKSLAETEQRPLHTLDRNRRVGNQSWEAVLGNPNSDATVMLGEIIQDALIAYLADLPQDAINHPFTTRLKFGMGQTGSWAESINESPDFTFSVDKVGWFKAIYFASVPQECDDENNKAGWLRFGIPDFGDKSDFTADAEIKPEAGKLVIFPAYYWYGFNALSASQPLTYIGVQGQSQAG